MDQEIKFFNAWFMFFLVATLGGMLLGAIVGFILGGMLGLAQVDLQNIKISYSILGFAIGMVLSFFVYKWTITQYIIPQVSNIDYQ